MDLRSFFTRLSILSFAATLIVLVMTRFEGLGTYLGFSLFCLAFFLLLSIAMFVMGKRTVASDNPHLFSYVVIFSIIVKIIGAVLLILIFMKLYSPPNRLFVIPFIFLYLLYSIFETNFMTRIGKANQKESHG